MQKNNQEYLDKLRHSAAHLLAAAVLELWPDAKPTIGPSIENGFYYDFDFGDTKVSDDDLKKIEEKMSHQVKEWKGFEKNNVSSDEAVKEFENNEYKKELVEEFSAKDQDLTIYQSGNFRDLCRGGHIDQPDKELKHFKLLSIAGAYWRGDEKNKMLTRIYGTAFPTKEELEKYIEILEEAKKRDHKILGKQYDLFTFSDLVGGGLPLWTPKGTLLRNILDDFVWELRSKYGYEKVEIPHITKKDLYEISGHWDKFKEELFRIKTREGHEFAMKPMNCPHHTQIFARKPHSYKEMPQRYATTTMVYRDEQSGELSGLSRVRAITQDDAHVFCRKSQAKEEIIKIWDIIDEFYKAAGFEIYVRLSLSDTAHPEKYLGKPEDWEFAENQLREVAKERGVEVIEAPGEAAFYAPKLDFMARDSIGREWQVATNQLDVNMPGRFGLYCINEDGEKEDIFMIHAAIMGSIERYLSILIEHFAGAFPVWLSPVQAKILPITERSLNYGHIVANRLKDEGIRIELDDRNETLGAKIRDAQNEKVPYMLIVGDKEEQAEKIAVRLRHGEDLGQIDIVDFEKRVTEKIKSKSLDL
jgi:threonyl-tRNA synthetase